MKKSCISSADNFLFVFTIFVYRIIFVLNGQFADRQLSVDDSVERDDGLGT